MGGQALAAAGGLVLVWLLSHTLSPKSYGILALALTLTALVNQSVTGAVAAAAGRYYAICAPRRDWHAYLHCLGRLFVYSLAGIGVFSILSLWLFSRSGQLPPVVVLSALLLSIISGYNATVGGIQTAARRRATSALFSTVDAWSKVFCCLGIGWFATGSALGVLLGLLVASLFVAAMQTAWIFRVNSGARQFLPAESRDGKERLLGSMFAYAWPFNVWGLFSWIQQSSDRWAIEFFGSTPEVGIYSVLFQVAYLPMTMLGNVACLVAGPVLFKRASSAAEAEKMGNVRSTTWLISFVLVAAAALAALAGRVWRHEISGLLTGPAFRDEVALWLPPVFFAGGLFAAGQFLSLRLMAEMQSRRILGVKVATSLLGLGLNLAGAFYYGLAGVVYAAVVFSVVHYLWMAAACVAAGKNSTPHTSGYETATR